jgi:O-antigen/teichoic acid export membrane protein
MMMAVFPAMSRIFTADPDSLPKLFRKNYDLMLLLGVPIGLGLMVISDQLVVLLFGEAFANSGVVLGVMGVVLIMTYQNMAIGQFLISTDRQNVWTKVMAIAIGVTILLDIVLIPFCQSQFDNGAIGGALSFLVTETAMTIYGIWLLRKELRSAPNGWPSIRIVAAGLLMVAGTWWLRDMFILVPIIVGAVIYSGAIVVLKVIPKEDRDMFGSMLQSLVARIRKLKPETSGVRG